MNTKKIVIVTACAAVLVGSAFAIRKVKNEVTRILKAEEPKEDDRNSYRGFADAECKRKYDDLKLNDCADMPEMPSDCCEAIAAVRPARRLGESMAAMGSCCDMEPMGKARLVD